MDGLNINGLPNEVILEVFKNLNGESLGTVAQTCKRFNILSNHKDVVTKKINLPKTIKDINKFIASMSAGFRKEDRELSEIMGRPLFVKWKEENKNIASILTDFIFIRKIEEKSPANETIVADLYEFVLKNLTQKEESSRALALCLRFLANEILPFDYLNLRGLIFKEAGPYLQNERMNNEERQPGFFARKALGLIILSAAFLRKNNSKKEVEVADAFIHFYSLVLYPSANKECLMTKDFEKSVYDWISTSIENVALLQYSLGENFESKYFEKFPFEFLNEKNGLSELNEIREIIKLLPEELKNYFEKDVIGRFDGALNEFLERYDLKRGFIDKAKGAINDENRAIFLSLKRLLKLDLTFKDIS